MPPALSTGDTQEERLLFTFHNLSHSCFTQLQVNELTIIEISDESEVVK